MIIGILAVASAATCLGIMPSMQKQLLVGGLPMNSLMFFTNWIISLVCIFMSYIKKSSLRAKPVQWGQAMLMGTAGMLITALLLNTSYLYLPVGMAIMLHFLYPTIVCIVMGTVFRQGFSKLQILAIVASISGMVFLAGGGGEFKTIGIIAALISSLTYSSYLIANEKGPANDLPIEIKLFYVSLPGTLLYTVLAPATGTLALPDGGTLSWLCLLGSGLFTSGGYFLMMYGISRLGASTSAFVSMLEPLVSAVVGTIWFHDPLSFGMVAGGCLVMISIFLIALDGNNKAKKEKAPSL